MTFAVVVAIVETPGPGEPHSRPAAEPQTIAYADTLTEAQRIRRDAIAASDQAQLAQAAMF